MESIANIQLDSSLVFLNKADTVKYQEYIGNFSNDTEIGSIFPKDENESWFVKEGWFAGLIS